jgi:hypothetical protein
MSPFAPAELPNNKHRRAFGGKNGSNTLPVLGFE